MRVRRFEGDGSLPYPRYAEEAVASPVDGFDDRTAAQLHRNAFEHAWRVLKRRNGCPVRYREALPAGCAGADFSMLQACFLIAGL